MNLASTIASDLLASAVSLVDDPPARQIVTHGNHAITCDLLAVVLHDLRLERPPGGRCTAIPVLPFSVVIARSCWPTVDADGGVETGLPDAAEVTAAASRLADDIWTLAIGMQERNAAGNLFPNARVACTAVIFTGSEPIGPFADVAGWRLNVEVRP